MQRRIIAAVVALVLALIGGVLVTGYVRAADLRAMVALEPVSVLVVQQRIPKGMAVRELLGLVVAKQLPRTAVAPGAVEALDQLNDSYVTSTELQPGEQVLTDRFVDPDSEVVTEDVKIPNGLQLLSVVLEPQRVLGARLKAGDKVGVFVSITRPDDATKLVANQVLVTRVQGGVRTTPATTTTAAPAPQASARTQEQVPENGVMVIMAVTAKDAQKIVYGLEHGKIWLSLQRQKPDGTKLPLITPDTVYK